MFNLVSSLISIQFFFAKESILDRSANNSEKNMDHEFDASPRASLIRKMSFKEVQDLAVVSPGEEMGMSPLSRRFLGRRPSVPFDPTNAMNRLRSGMVGGPHLHSAVTVAAADGTITPSLSNSSFLSDELVGESAAKATRRRQRKRETKGAFMRGLGQIPAIALIAIFHLMIGIPFGVSYFPMSWSPYVQEASEEEGPFPLPGKEALGIRMFLFSTIVGQIVFTLSSGFDNPIGLQMVENVPFCHELANIVIQHQGYGLEAISTLLVMFGLSSIFVGAIFYFLGKRNLGRVVYFFPTHVLIGCIGGIGVFLAKTGLEVTMANVFSVTNIIGSWSLLWIIFAFEGVLRILERLLRDDNGQPMYSLLSPIYFCMITPVFYMGLAIAGITIKQANDRGFFFPPLDDDSSPADTIGTSMWMDSHTWDMWKVIDISTVSWAAIWDSVPTLLALSLFSLIHVPINIPAFALSSNTEADMNKELVAHGYSNIIAGLFGGLQNYMAYTQSVLYAKSGGRSKPSGLAVAAATSVLFFIGPAIASYIPRCMAGALLLHVGIDLFLEGVWDSYGKFDLLEYSGILLIIAIMTSYGMEAAMMAGVVAAVSTYAVQSVAYLSPIRGSMSATTLRSSQISRSPKAYSILNSHGDGRTRILVVQLQGHLFFGNMANFTDKMHQLMKGDKKSDQQPPVVVVVDCSLVLGIDSSAAQAIAKLKDTLLKNHEIELFIFVTGSDRGFPTEFPLTDKLMTCHPVPIVVEDCFAVLDETTSLLQDIQTPSKKEKSYRGSHVFHTLDEALTYAEDALIARVDWSLLEKEAADLLKSVARFSSESTDPNGGEEKAIVTMYLRKICYMDIPDKDVDVLVALFTRQVYNRGDYLWRQHSESDCAKLLVSGILRAELENEAGTTESIFPGALIGEVGLVNGDPRMSSVQCTSDEAILYSLSREAFDQLVATNPKVARYIDLICIRYLALRVQHVSNRIFETRCLPI